MSSLHDAKQFILEKALDPILEHPNATKELIHHIHQTQRTINSFNRV